MHTFQRPRITRSLSDNESPDVKPLQQSQPKRPSTTQSALGTSTRPLSTVVKAPAPQRPPRNPARSDTVPLPAPIPVVAANRAIATVAAGIDARPRTATGFREDVTPWELYPVPDYAFAESSRPGHNRVSISSRPTTSSGRPSSSGGRPSGLNFTEGFVRRRKSTGAKQVKLHAPKPIMGTGTSKPHVLSHPAHKSTSPPPSSFFPLSSNIYAGPFLASVPASVVIPKLPPLPPPKPAEKHYPTDNNLKFSTADRTILEELKRNIKAREAQFIVKGGTSGCGKPGFGPDGRDGWGVGALGGIGVMGGRKHHPFHKEEVPYPRSYEREVLDLDIWETSFCQQICDSTTWHVFDTPPKKVLDIGCGTGAWILNCARAWRECHFVGLDIVPLHPDLHQVGSIDLAQRITWTQGNFLEFLPFPNEEFDYVHIKRIALGVPEDKWDHLFEEITRVMKPGGAFEMIEEDLFFPGHSPDEGDDDDSDIESESRSSVEMRRQSGNSKPYSTTSRSSDHDHDDADTDSTMPTSMYDSGISARQSEEVGTSFVDIPSPGYLSSGSAVSLSGSPILPSTNAPVTGSTIAEDDEERTDNDGTITQASHIQRRSLSSIMTPSTALPPKASSSKSRQKSEPPFEHTVQPQKLHAASSISLHTKHTLTAPPVTRPRRMSLSTTTPPPPRRTSSFHADITHRPPQPPPFLSRSIKPPPNPRDHTILETIYNEMQASRFINLSPLSLLPNYLNQYFTDIRTHPPLQFAFPPLPLKIKVPEVVEDEWDPDQEARNAINPFPAKSPERRLSLDSVLGDEKRWLSARNLLNRSSQFVSLDDSRFSGVSPRASGFPALPTVDPQPTSSPSIPPSKPSSLIKHTLPNKKLSIDVKALNLHLALRRAEILGCSEEMWEWVLEFQAELRRQRKEEASMRAMKERSKSVDMTRSPTLRGRPHSIGGRTWHEPQGPKAEIAELAREDFEELLSRFDMDMSDHIALGSQVESRFSWSSFKSAPSVERKSFDAACERYERWQGESQQEKYASRPTSSDGSHRDSNGLPGPSEHLLLRERTHRPDSFRGIQQLMPPNTTSFGSARRLCRTIGVFVAWKPSSPTDDDSD